MFFKLLDLNPDSYMKGIKYIYISKYILVENKTHLLKMKMKSISAQES